MPEFEAYPGESPEEANRRINENKEQAGIPSSNAMERSVTEESPSDYYQIGGMVEPNVPSYKKGGKVTDITDVVKEASKQHKRLTNYEQAITMGGKRGKASLGRDVALSKKKLEGEAKVKSKVKRVLSKKEGGKVREWQKNPKDTKFHVKPEKQTFRGKEVKPVPLPGAKFPKQTLKGKEVKPVSLPTAVSKKKKKKK